MNVLSCDNIDEDRERKVLDLMHQKGKRQAL